MNKIVLLIIGFAVGLLAGLFLARGMLPHEMPSGPASLIVSPPINPRTRIGSSAQRQQQLRSAVAALEALESATRAGVTYQNYIERKIDAHVPVDRYTREFGDDAPLALTLREALAAFDAAGQIWSACIRSEGCQHDILHPDTSDPVIAEIFRQYPGLAAMGDPYNAVLQETALTYLWQQAAEAIAGARRAL